MGDHKKDTEAEAEEDDQQTPSYPTPGGLRGL